MGKMRRIPGPRWFLVGLILFLVSAPAAQAAAPDHITFSISPNVSAEDEMYVREGIQLAANYLEESLGTTVEERVIVNARASATLGRNTIGVAGAGWIGIATGAPGWEMSAPFLRVEAVVHEYVHIQQRALMPEDAGRPALWLTEGISEVLGYQAVQDQGLVSAEDVAAYHTNVVTLDWLPALVDLETAEAYHGANPSVYSLAYLAVRSLVDEHGISAVTDFYAAYRDARDWESAFATAFGQSTAEFYAAFEAKRGALVTPDFPVAFTPVFTLEAAAPFMPGFAPERVARGEQMIVQGLTIPLVTCTLTVSTPAGRTLLEQPATADRTGSVFWLWTVPNDARRGETISTFGCGAETVRATFRIAS